jgi:hypothetical protein
VQANRLKRIFMRPATVAFPICRLHFLPDAHTS